jgi:dipeptidyl aminopeptidase/acylaminoacyl peptidase
VGDEQLWKASIDGTTATPAIASSDAAAHAIDMVVPAATEHVAWSTADRRAVIVMTRHATTRRSGLARVDLGSGVLTPIVEEDKRYSYSFGASPVSRDGSTIAYVAEDVQHPSDLWIARLDDREPRQITHVNPRLDSYTLGTSRIVDYRNRQGQALQGALLLPAGYQAGRRYPLIVHVYGGMVADTAQVFGLAITPNAQVFATRGYAVLFPSAPYRVGTPMADLVDGAMSAIDAVIAEGIADPDRIGVMGHSYGGYATLGLVTQSQRFKAAISSAGFGDLVSSYQTLRSSEDAGRGGGIGWAETGQGSMGGTPWQYRDRYIENSPFYVLDRVRTPVLLLHGEEDRTAPPPQSDAVFVALRRLGREVEYRRYANEGHSVRGLENLRDLYTAAIRWFETYLKGGAEEITGTPAPR